MCDITLNKNERLDDLQVSGLKIIQNTEQFCFGCDAVEIANFVSKSGKGFVNACDLGSGNGIISILIASKKGYSVTAVELQSSVASLCSRNIELNNLTDKVRVVNEDMLKFGLCKDNLGKYDVVVSNPPYETIGSGQQSMTTEVRIARSEEAVTLEGVIKSASNLCKFGGKFYLVHKAERLADAIAICTKCKLEPKVLQVLTPNDTKSPHLFMMSCTKGGKAGISILKERSVAVEY